MSDEFVKLGQEALKAGDKEKARKYLQSAIQQNPQNETAWLWLAGASVSSFERALYLEKALAINPGNAGARKALDKIRGEPAVVKPEIPSPPPVPSVPIQEVGKTPAAVENLPPLKSQPKKRRKRNPFLPIAIVFVAVVIIVGGVVGWYYFYGPCGKVKVDQANKQLSDLYLRYNDAEELAANTGRIALSGPIATMQRIKQEAEKTNVPGCMVDARDYLALAMDWSIKGYLAFAGQDTDATVTKYFRNSVDDFGLYKREMSNVEICAPFCK